MLPVAAEWKEKLGSSGGFDIGRRMPPPLDADGVAGDGALAGNTKVGKLGGELAMVDMAAIMSRASPASSQVDPIEISYGALGVQVFEGALSEGPLFERCRESRVGLESSTGGEWKN